MAKLSDKEVRALVEQRYKTAMDDHVTLSGIRSRAMDFYYARPLGNEIDGRSQVVTKEFQNAVEWIMPSLKRIFTTKQAVTFDPVGPEDVDLAKQESMYVSHVLWKQNSGYSTIGTWLKDGLMQKVGYIIYWWEETKKVCIEEYTGLTQEQLVLTLQSLEQRGTVDVIGQEIHGTAPGVQQFIDIKVKITESKGHLCIEPVPPDEVIVSSDCRGGVKNAKFAGRLRRITRSALMEMGFSREEVENVTDFSTTPSLVAPSRSATGKVPTDQDAGVDWATKELTMLDCFTSIDIDDDGYAELRHFLVHGDGFLTNEDCDEIQMCSWTPIPMPHQHYGLDLFDASESEQRIGTALTRSLLDNAYFGNNQRIVYDKNTVDYSMLQINRPGGHVANDGPVVGAYAPLPVNDIGPRLLPIIQYFHDRHERAVGVGEGTTGVDADVLAQSTKGAFMQAVGAANQRIEAIAREFAETGLSDLYQSMHRMLMKHQDWPTRFKLKDEWVTVNPTEWIDRANITVSVGLGTAGKEEIRSNLGLMGQVLQQAAQVPGLIQPKNVYAYVQRMQTELGLEGEEFVTDPNSAEYQQWQQSHQPQQDPYVEGAKIKAQTEERKSQRDAQQKTLDRALERDLTITKLEVETGVDLAKTGIGAEVAAGRGNGTPWPGGAGTDRQRPVQ